jgi:hypothetical protein
MEWSDLRIFTPPGRDARLGYHKNLRHLPRLRAFVDEVLRATSDTAPP